MSFVLQGARGVQTGHDQALVEADFAAALGPHLSIDFEADRILTDIAKNVGFGIVSAREQLVATRPVGMVRQLKCRFAAFVAVLLLTSTAQVEASGGMMSEPFARSGAWEITRNEGDCSLAVTFDRGSRLSVFYNHSADMVRIHMSDLALKHFKPDTDESFELIFTRDTVIDTARLQTMRVSPREGYPSVHYASNGTSVLDELARNDKFGVFFDDEYLFSASLSGSGKAIILLRECSRSEKRKPVHPDALIAAPADPSNRPREP